MKIETIKVSKEFRAITGGLWLGIEASVSEEENKIEAFKEGMDFLDKAFMANNPQINWSDNPYGSINVYAPEQPTDKIQAFIDTINYCTNPTMVERFRKQVERENNERLTEAFNSKLKSFQ